MKILKLKSLKNYFHSAITYLATIALEGNMLDKIDFEFIIEDLILKNTKRMMLFK